MNEVTAPSSPPADETAATSAVASSGAVVTATIGEAMLQCSAPLQAARAIGPLAPEVVHRPMSLAEIQPGANGAGNVVLRQRDGLLQSSARGKLRGQRRRKCAPGSVGVAALHPERLEFRKVVPVVQQVKN